MSRWEYISKLLDEKVEVRLDYAIAFVLLLLHDTLPHDWYQIRGLFVLVALGLVIRSIHHKES